MSRVGKVRDTLGLSKFRILLWLIVLASAWGLFNSYLKINDKDRCSSYSIFRFYSENNYNEIREVNGKYVQGTQKEPESRFLWIYNTKDTGEKANADAEKARLIEIAKSTGGSRGYGDFEYDYNIYGIGYRNEKHGQAIAISLVLPLVLILLTIVFEKPIVRKLEKMNS